MQVNHQPIELKHGRPYSVIRRGAIKGIKCIFLNSSKFKDGIEKKFPQVPSHSCFMYRDSGGHKFIKLDDVAYVSEIRRQITDR